MSGKYERKNKEGVVGGTENQRISNVYATLPFSLWGHFPLKKENVIRLAVG